MSVEEVVKKALLAITIILIAIAILGLYISLNQLIDVWVSYKYAPLYRILLNSAVLLIAAYFLISLRKSW